MRKPRLNRYRAVTALPVLLLALALIAACGTAEEPTSTPLPPPTVAPAVAPTAAPTAMPAMADTPADSMMAQAEYAPAFADYWNPPTDYYGQPVYGGTLRINYEDPLEHANLWGAASGVTDRYRNPTTSGLVMEDPYNAGGPFVPDAAAGWTVHDDSQGITFQLREGVKWHNGDILTCEDARFSFETMATGTGLTASYMQGSLGHVDTDALTCEDDLSLSFRWAAPTGTPLLALSNRRAAIFNKAWFEAGGEEAMFQDVSVGTGPFMWAEGQKVGVDEQRFEKNPDYFIPELPYVDELVIFGILDEAAQQAAMLAHQTDWHWVRNWGQYDAYVDHDQIQTVIRPTRGNFELWINPRIAPFDNVKVRQAIVMGIDRNAAIKILQDGRAAAGFIMPPGSPWELSQEEGCAVPGWCVSDNPDATRAEAKAILEAEGFDFDETYLFTVESDEQVVNRATFLQEQLRLMGVKTDFDLVETIAYRTLETTGEWGAFLPGNDTMAADDPNAGMGRLLACESTGNLWTPAYPCDSTSPDSYDQLLAQAQTETDRTARKALSNQIELTAMKEYRKFPVYWEQEAVSFWPEVRGYVHFPAPFGSFRKHQHMWIDPGYKDDSSSSGQTSGVPGGF